MLYKGGVARAALAEALGLVPEVVQDRDYLSSLNEDSNVKCESSPGMSFDELLAIYMGTRDCSINEVLFDSEQGTVYATEDCIKSFVEGIIILRERTTRALCRAIRFSVRYGFQLDTGGLTRKECLRLMNDDSDEVIHQWTKAVLDRKHHRYIEMVETYGWDRQESTPYEWWEVEEILAEERREEEADTALDEKYKEWEAIELSLTERKR